MSELNKNSAVKKIMYLQYVDPGHYPPLIHSSEILSKHGARILILGMHPFGGKIFSLQRNINISVRYLKYRKSKIWIKLQYLQYIIWSLCWTLRFQPEWIYASDYLATPAAYLIKILFKKKVLYHEHDSPTASPANSFWMRICLKFREKTAKRSEIIVLPHPERIKHFIEEIKTKAQPLCVYNCPGIAEVNTEDINSNREYLSLVYCGSINEKRLPKTILHAMSKYSDSIRLNIIGYETIGSVGYLKQYQKCADDLKISGQVISIGPKKRADALHYIGNCDLGLCFMPNESGDINMIHMAGASNKPFDYLSQGVAVLVSHTPEWKKMYVDQGYGFACNPESVKDMESIFEYCLKNRNEVKNMGCRGRDKVLKEWNYENMFQPVLDQILISESKI